MNLHVQPKTTLEGLRRRMEHHVPPPTWHTRATFDKMTPSEQEAYDDARLRWFRNGIFIKTPATRRLDTAALSLLRVHDPDALGERGIVLTGPAHIGKTTALIKTAAKVEDHVARRNPGYLAEGQAPVAYVEMSPKASPKSIASSILDFYGIPHNFTRASQHQLTTAALDAIRRRRARFLIFDELQMLKLDGKMGDDAVNALKTIMNDSGAICVFSGIDLTNELSSRAAEQIMNRCQVIQMEPVSSATDIDRGQWAALVKTLGAAMHLLDADEDSLLPYADLLLGLSKGKVGDLREILQQAMVAAIEDRLDGAPEAITRDTLLGVGSIGVA